jgi:hypothetical protein
VVTLTLMAECRGGNHEKCPESSPAAPGEFGGVICECSCHSKGAEIEHELWCAIRDGENPADFERYLSQFPDGVYAGLAQMKLAQLRKK